jgi:hypothetical protein
MTTNPLELPPPDDPLERVHMLARDLAYGAVQGLWSPRIIYIYDGISAMVLQGGANPLDANIIEYIERKWHDDIPDLGMLVSFGFFTILNTAKDRTDYIITDKAFALLDKPVTPASIFISYKREESSAFALLLLARLKAVGLDAFLDMKDLSPGDDWHSRLEEEVKRRKYFICLIGPSTLDSPYVREEIRWAMETKGIRTLPIWHRGFAYDPDEYPEFAVFLSKNAIVVEREHAKAYNNAVIELLNFFGFTPT